MLGHTTRGPLSSLPLCPAAHLDMLLCLCLLLLQVDSADEVPSLLEGDSKVLQSAASHAWVKSSPPVWTSLAQGMSRRCYSKHWGPQEKTSPCPGPTCVPLDDASRIFMMAVISSCCFFISWSLTCQRRKAVRADQTILAPGSGFPRFEKTWPPLPLSSSPLVSKARCLQTKQT